MTRDRILRNLAGVVLVIALALVVLPILILTLIFTPSLALYGVAAIRIASVMVFDAAFDAGQWLGFLLIALVFLSAGYLLYRKQTRLWLRAALCFLIAAAIWTGWQGYRFQQQRVALVRANYALCPMPDKSNRVATSFRAALDARAAFVRTGGRFRLRVPIDDAVSPFIPAGMSLARAEILAKAAGLNVQAPTRFQRGMDGGQFLAFSVNCKYDVGFFASQEMSIAVYHGTDAAGQSLVGRTEAFLFNATL